MGIHSASHTASQGCTAQKGGEMCHCWWIYLLLALITATTAAQTNMWQNMFVRYKNMALILYVVMVKTLFRPVASHFFYYYQIPVHKTKIMVSSILATLLVRPGKHLSFHVWIMATAMYQNYNKKNYAI